MAELLSAPIGAPIAVENGTTTSCSYPPGEAGSYAQADLEIDWKDVRDRAFGEQMVDAFGGTSVGRQVAHRVDLGDGGTYSNEGVLTIRARGARITVTLPMRPRSEEQAAAIGRTVLARLEDTGR